MEAGRFMRQANISAKATIDIVRAPNACGITDAGTDVSSVEAMMIVKAIGQATIPNRSARFRMKNLAVFINVASARINMHQTNVFHYGTCLQTSSLPSTNSCVNLSLFEQYFISVIAVLLALNASSFCKSTLAE
jgi:hypothetical protein